MNHKADIVERLRNIARSVPGLHVEAADEIERLRAENAKTDEWREAEKTAAADEIKRQRAEVIRLRGELGKAADAAARLQRQCEIGMTRDSEGQQ